MPVGSSASLLGLAPPWRHALVSGSHLDPKMTENSGCGAVRAGKRRAWTWKLLFRLRLTGIGWDMSDSEEAIWDPISSLAASCPRVTSYLIPPSHLSRKRRRTDRKDFYHVPQHHKPKHICEIHFPANFPFKAGPPPPWGYFSHLWS